MSLLLITAEKPILEHLETRNGQPLTSFVYPTILLALVRPRRSSPRIEQHRNEEEVDKPPASLRGIYLLWPARKQFCDSVSSSGVEVLPAAVRRDTCIIRIEIALHKTDN
jgi:hypothetical protein